MRLIDEAYESEMLPSPPGSKAIATQMPKSKEDGAGATADAAAGAPRRALRDSDYVAWLTPRIGGQPWTAPVYDGLDIPKNNPPRVFCMASVHDGHGGCSCLTEQGTRYAIEQNRCRMIATDGQYEPFIDTNRGNLQLMDEVSQRARLDTRGGGVRARTLRRRSHPVQCSARHRSAATAISAPSTRARLRLTSF